MRIRIGHRGARCVLEVRRTDGVVSERRWLALHRAPHDWQRIFDVALARLDLTGSSGVQLHWTPHASWTTIRLRLTDGSLRKRQLIAAALLKAARYQVR